MSMSITDAKPMLEEPPGKVITNVFVTIDEVLVHKSGGAWVSLDLPDSPSPFEIDLMQYSDGTTTELVPPVALEAGRYTQVRLSVVSARIVFNNDPNDQEDVTVPSGNLKTDQNFEFTVGGAAVDITVDFDLSKSLVRQGNGSYQLEPVLHIVETEVAATIEGSIAYADFADPPNDYAVVTVYTSDTPPEVYTTVRVDRAPSAGQASDFEIFWLVPGQDYRVEVDYDPAANDGNEAFDVVGSGDFVNGVATITFANIVP
jgi:hypothetical protein